jgi:SAM-dependent methyltransferase
VRARTRLSGAWPESWTGSRAPADDGLELAYEVRPREIRTWITVLHRTGEVETRRGHGIELPFGDDSFGRVRCRRGLQLLPDRGRALEEIHRVLVQGGEIDVSVRGSIERSPPFAHLADSLERHAGPRGAAAVRWLFCMPEPDDLRGLLAAAAFEQIQVDVIRTTDRSPSIRAFLAGSGSEPGIVPLGVERDVLADLEHVLGPWVDRSGLLITAETIVGRARRT